jgi:hypothetical protein
MPLTNIFGNGFKSVSRLAQVRSSSLSWSSFPFVVAIWHPDLAAPAPSDSKVECEFPGDYTMVENQHNQGCVPFSLLSMARTGQR